MRMMPMMPMMLMMLTMPMMPMMLTMLTMPMNADDVDDNDDEYTLAAEAIKESFEITEVVDRDGKSVRLDGLKLSLQTLRDNGDYWLDTGCFIP